LVREIAAPGFSPENPYGEVWLMDYLNILEISRRIYPWVFIAENVLFFFFPKGKVEILDEFILGAW